MFDFLSTTALSVPVYWFQIILICAAFVYACLVGMCTLFFFIGLRAGKENARRFAARTELMDRHLLGKYAGSFNRFSVANAMRSNMSASAGMGASKRETIPSQCWAELESRGLANDNSR